MQKINIKTHNPKNNYEKPHFFILSKGYNSGKPLVQSCPNCFVLEFTSEQEKENNYWLAYSLWQSKFWRYYLVGSVVLFLRLHEFKPQFIAKGEALQNSYAQHIKNVQALNLLEEKEIEFSKNIALIKEMRAAILHTYTRI
ncbi:DUF6943 family protein [Flavobacterium sp.]|uniref:DUF6943 family protein n=1 Tax=Flavobacterium sp. TaxID=239 RepID=UPI0039E69477